MKTFLLSTTLITNCPHCFVRYSLPTFLQDPKYHHLSEDLHVEITAFAPPAEAHARLSYALTEVRKYLIPDSNDQIRQLQMKERP